jgi:hypothetical protein
MSVCIVTSNITRRGITLVDFTGGNQSANDLKTFFDTTFLFSNEILTPTAGGNLTLNGQNVGPYDYVLKRSDQTLTSTPTSSDWFTSTKDTRSSIIGVAGDLTINSGAFLRPPDRKLFMAIYVQGNLTVNGNISMTARGANHSGSGTSGGSTTAREIRLATGTFGGISNPVVPAAGSAGSSGRVGTGSASANPAQAASATGGGTGGGGGGGGGIIAGSGTATLGSGADGTCFSSGGGGGGMYNNSQGTRTSGSAGANGGAGGNAWNNASGHSGAGAGNPAGLYTSAAPGNSAGNHPYTSNGWAYYRNNGINAVAPWLMVHEIPSWSNPSTSKLPGQEIPFEGYDNGTAGTLVIYVSGTLSGSGNIDSSGFKGGTDGGGGSGGGSITIFYNTDSSSITPRAPGQKGSAWNSTNGGLGGTGTARKLSGL